MIEHFIDTPFERETLLGELANQELPFAVRVYEGTALRSMKQNNLQFKWLNEISKVVSGVTGETPEEVRGYCKLHFGVPIRRRDDDDFRERYDRMVKPLPYPTKRALMQEPFDFAVTREMNKKQMSEYLDAVFKHYAENGIELTQPPETPMPAPRKRAAA